MGFVSASQRAPADAFQPGVAGWSQQCLAGWAEAGACRKLAAVLGISRAAALLVKPDACDAAALLAIKAKPEEWASLQLGQQLVYS